MKLDHVIIKPIISEKSLDEAAFGRYTFLVAKDANKRQVKEAIKRLFKVDVTEVFSAVIKKTVNRRTRQGIKKLEVPYKKARVNLKAGQKIEIFEVNTSEAKK